MIKKLILCRNSPQIYVTIYEGSKNFSSEREIAEAIGSTAEAVQKRWERILKWLRPIAHQLDELIGNLPSQERKIMERYLDNQPLEEITKKEGISPTNVEVCVKRVIKRWKKTVTQNATTKVKRRVID